jgi:uncharacterized damage-inducible protein DinB
MRRITMMDLAATVGHGFSGYYETVRRKVHDVVEPLSDDQLWSRPYPYGNSIGHLLLHLTGNLGYYVGTQIAGTGYVREREREFTETRHRSKLEVLQAFDAAIDLVTATLARQSSADWSTPYTAVGETDAGDRFTLFLRCAAHAYHHVGQMIYLRKEIEHSPAARV